MDRRTRRLASLLGHRNRGHHDPDERGLIRALILFVGGELVALLAIGAGLVWLASQYRP
jgi:hypothetical protein